MFDVKLLDHLNFGALGDALSHVLEKMDEIEAELSEDEGDPRIDILLVIANQIFVRMDSIVRDYGRSHPEVLDQWSRAAGGYGERFKQYARTYLKGGVPLLMVEPESSAQASGADAAAAAARARLDEVLDEKSLDGMNAGDLFEVADFITETVKRLDEELPEDLAEPIIAKLLKFSDLVFKRLDPLVREAYKDEPEKLAAWLEIVNDCKDLDAEGGEDVQADVHSSEVS